MPSTEKPLTEHFRKDGRPLSLAEYEEVGGYRAWRKVVQQMAPLEVIQQVSDAKLLGRGGAGFPAGLKWHFMPTGADAPLGSYVVCNADEMEPGTFKDRILMEGNPHQLIEGIAIACYAVNARTAYLFLRGEYRRSAECLEKAITEAYQSNYLGDNILGSHFGLSLFLHISAGRYMCGEASGTLNALEGLRANPRARPPHLSGVGLWAKPTLVNNVETLFNVPPIMDRGAQWFLDLSLLPEGGGTKIYCVSGRVKKPGAYELPLGTTMREIIEDHAGGMCPGFGLRAAIPGGASTSFILEQDMDVAMGFSTMGDVASSLGTGAIVVLDDKTCPVGMMANLEQFFARESCGWCTPCWEGLAWTHRILESIEAGKGKMEDLEILEHHTRMLLPDHTFCDLAPTAMNPLRSGMKYFRDDLEEHIIQQRCPWR